MVVTSALKGQDLPFSSDNIPYFGHLGINDRYFCYSWVRKSRNLNEVQAKVKSVPLHHKRMARLLSNSR